MPRGRCHFALLLALQNQLETTLPNVGELTRTYFSDFLAGSLAPDAMRSLGKLGKFRSHFYSEDKPDTWGKSVSGMFEMHPGLANPSALSGRDQVFLLGYISHLTTDEAFRDEVTIHVHGVEEWRPIIRGLWSLIDELPIEHSDLGREIDLFNRSDTMGFIDFDIARVFLQKARGWAVETDPWAHEQVFLSMINKAVPEDVAKATFAKNRRLAAPYLSEEHQEKFVDRAVVCGLGEVKRFIEGGYAENG